MKVIGLCGGSGSGKGMVSAFFENYGIPSIDTDAVYRKLTSYDSLCLRALVGAFGKDIISDEGSLNRSVLAKIVFTGDGAEERLKKLNTIAHKFILDETRIKLEGYKELGFKAAIVDAPVLFESGFNKECDLIISVIADKEIRIERIIKRDNISRESAEARIESQISNDELISKSNFVIDNNSDLPSLEKKVKKIAELILNN